MTTAPTEAAGHADFTQVRYAQCWEDADALLDALDVQPGDVCLSIASAGDNSFSLLTRDPKKVVALDLNPAQLACVELRRAAYRALDHDGLLQLIGSRSSDKRRALYQRCRSSLPNDAKTFWDAHPAEIDAGIGSAGKFERYFALFRKRILPLVHRRRTVEQLLAGGTRAQRLRFYNSTWDTWRWRLLFRLFFSRRVLSLGRDPAFFRYVEGSVAARILSRARHALVELNPAKNPYLQWILTGSHPAALPHALRPENFERIQRNLDRLEVRKCSIEQYLDSRSDKRIHRFNLSDIFEYMSAANFEQLLERLVKQAAPGGRLAYWNMLVPRSRPETMAARLKPKDEWAARLHAADKAFFYSRLVVEEVV